MKAIRAAAVVLTAALFLQPASISAHPAPAVDVAIVRSASLRLGHEGPGSVIRWLRVLHAVRTAGWGRDRRSLDIRFADGTQGVVLPRAKRSVRLDFFRPQEKADAPPAQSSGARAAVWEPFASELGLGPNAGDIEVQQLRGAGFGVDQAYDTQVTVGLMRSLSQYAVVYMHTHSGVDQSGEGVLATGQPANGDPSVLPLLQNGSVLTIGVAGSSQAYYGVTTRYITNYEAQFSPHSLLFLNGCALLRATTFWNALKAKGVGVMVSWDQNAAAKDDYLSAAAFFNVMASGQSVSGALSTIKAAGYGTSSDKGIPASLGYLGDGSVTLQQAASGAGAGGGPAPTATNSPPPAETPVPTAPSTVTPILATATPTAVPTTANTPVAAQIALSSLVRPGSSQKITVRRVRPNTDVKIQVLFPNGDEYRTGATADGTGVATVAFIEPPSKVARYDRVATVAVTATTASGTATQMVKYGIRLGEIDVVAQPRKQHAGKPVTIYVHTRAHRPIVLSVRFPRGKRIRMYGTTGLRGWVRLTYTVKRSMRPGQRAVVRADVRFHGKRFHASTSFSVD